MRPTPLLIGLALALTFALAGCAKPSDEGGHLIEIVGMQDGFEPATLTITVGETVTWKNMDSLPHTVTSDDGMFEGSDVLERGEIFEFTFEEAGEYAYHCEPHPNMKATIIVQNATA